MASKKPSLGEVAVLSGGDDPDADDGSYDAAVDEFLELVGVPEDKMADARDAFKAAVAACM